MVNSKIKSTDIASLQRVFQCVSALDAVELLCGIFNAPEAIIYIDNKTFALSALHNDFQLNNLSAGEVDILFYGGPPGHSKWFTGTLLTLLMDHAAYCLSKGNNRMITEAIRWVQKNGQLV